jgi:hypothetical protein
MKGLSQTRLGIILSVSICRVGHMVNNELDRAQNEAVMAYRTFGWKETGQPRKT